VKALITGGRGFVGRHLSDALRTAGHEVEALDLAGPPSEVDYHECDIRDFDRLVTFLRAIKPDCVVHLAAWSSVGRSFKNPTRAFEINAQGTVNLLEAIRGLDLKAKVLVVSSAEVYGAVETGGLTGEDNPVAPVSPYALGKACAELSSLYYGGIGGVDIIIVRAFNHTGPGQTDVFALPGFARQIAEAERGLREPRLHVGNLDVVRDFTDVRDVVRAYRVLLEGAPPGALYNVCSGRGHKLRELVDKLVSMSSVSMEIVVDRERWRPAEIESLVGDNSQIARDTGWRPEIPMEKTLEDLLEYWRGRVSDAVDSR
jgi:GDP-4-dehydro-6-deoxy-D-mannose reductase